MIKRGFGDNTTGISPRCPGALNYKDLKIAEAVTHQEKSRREALIHNHAHRMQAHKDFVFLKHRHGSSVVALRAAILEESQRHWLKSAKEIAEIRSDRAKQSFKGLPNTKTGACCTAADFRKAIEQ